jgi:hypothetical protein
MSGIQKLDIAKELLESALFHYYETQSYFASLHLAGAAEEVLGRYVENTGSKSSFASLRDGAVRISEILYGEENSSCEKSIAQVMNSAKNSTKHMNEKNDDRVFFDAKSAAKDLLDRAVTNYYHLMQYYPLDESENLRRFNNELTQA